MTLRHKIMIYKGHTEGADGHSRINFLCQDNNKNYYYYWYYNSSVYYNTKYDHTDDADLLYELLNADIIDLSYSPEQLYVFSNGFLPKALLYLTHDDAEIDSTVVAIAATVEKDTEAERMEEAKQRLFSEPEQYFPDLATDSVPVTRNSRIPEVLAARPF